MRLENRICHIISVFFVFLISVLIVLFNFKKGYYLIGGDVGTAQIFPIELIRQSFFMWQAKFAPGSGHLGWNLPAVFPYLSFLGLLIKMDISKFMAQRIYFFGLIFTAGISMYYLIVSNYLFKEKAGKFVAGVSGAVFYILNHYTMMMFSSATSNYSLSYIFMPLILAMFIKTIDRDASLRDCFFVGLVSIFCCTTTNLAQTGVIILLLAGYSVSYMVFNKRFVRPLKGFIFIMFACFLFNAWWLIPYLNNISTELSIVENMNESGWLNWMCERSSILNLFRLDGYTGWIKDFPYALSFNRYPILILCGYFISLLPFCALFFSGRNWKILFFSIISLAGIFLAKGVHPPFSILYRWAFKNIPGFLIYRSPYDKFVPVIALGYAWLIGISLAGIWQLTRNRKRILFSTGVISIILILGVYPWPFWKGNLIRTPVSAKPSFWVKIPKEYFKTASWINSQKGDSKVLILPPAGRGYLNYSWGYFGENIYRNLLNKPVFIDSKFNMQILKAVKYRHADLLNILRLYNIKYVLLDGYIMSDIDVEEIKRILVYCEGLKLLKEEGKISIYSVEDSFFLPHIYTSERLLNVYADEEVSFALTNTLASSGKPFFVQNKKDAESTNYEYFVYMWNNMEGQKDFYVPRNGNYIIKACLNLKLLNKKVKKGFVVDWAGKLHFDGNKVEYKYNFTDCLTTEVYFDGNGKEDEYMRIKGDLNVDLKEFPWFELNYKVQDKSVQTIELVIGVDFNGDNTADGYIRGVYPYPASEELSSFRFCVYDKARDLFPDAKAYKAVLLEIYPHKLWGADCSSNKKGWYRFFIKNIEFCDLSNEKYLSAKDGGIIDSTIAKFDESIFKLDGEAYKFSTVVEVGIVKDNIYFGKIYFDKGIHSVEALNLENFNIDWFIVEKDEAEQKIGPAISFKTANPAKYEVYINSTEDPFGLVFSESFSKGWYAWVELDRKLELEDHYKVNGYANGWWIDINKIKNHPDTIGTKIKNNENLKIIIEYKPQKLVWIGFIVSGISLGIIGFLSIFWRNRHG